MTFGSDLVRHIFHQLPTDVQVTWYNWEKDLAEEEQGLHILSVMSYEDDLEVTVRIDSKLNISLPIG